MDVNVVNIFLKRNFKKFIPSCLTLITFLFIFNLITGVMLSVTDNFRDSIVNNKALYIMEINFRNYKDINLIDKKNSYKEIEDVDDAFVDFSHPVAIESKNSGNIEVVQLVGVPKSVVNRFSNIENPPNNFLVLPEILNDRFKEEELITFEEGEYFEEEGKIKSKLVNYDLKVTGFYKEFLFDYFPPNVVLIDETLAEKIAIKSSENGSPIADRMIMLVTKVDKMDDVSKAISKDDKDVQVKYDLKMTKNLPDYAVIMLAISSVIIVVLLALSCINIYNSIKQMLNLRIRDIALFDILGIEEKKIKVMFLQEFTIYSIATFIMSIIITICIFSIFKVFFSFNLLGIYIIIYIISNFCISVIVFLTITYIQITKQLGNLTRRKIYKEVLK